MLYFPFIKKQLKCKWAFEFSGRENTCAECSMAVWLTAVYRNAHQINHLLNKGNGRIIIFLLRQQALFGKVTLVIYCFLRRIGTTYFHTLVQRKSTLVLVCIIKKEQLVDLKVCSESCTEACYSLDARAKVGTQLYVSQG